MFRSKVINEFVCPCEEKSFNYADDSFVPLYCPFCGVQLDEAEDYEEDVFYSDSEEWDEQDNTRF